MTNHELRKLRIEKGLTQHELAEIVGFNKYRISDLECGKREATASEIEKLKRALGIAKSKENNDIIPVSMCKGCINVVEDDFIFADKTHTVRCERNGIFLCFAKGNEWIIKEGKAVRCNFGG